MSDYINREMAADCIVIECDDVTLEQARQAIKDCPSADVIEIGRPYKRDKDHVLYFEITKDDYGDEWWTIRRQDNGSKNSK